MYFIFDIIIFLYIMYCFFVCRLYIRFFFYHWYYEDLCLFILCLFLVIISEIGIIVCDYIIIDISFIFMCCLGFYDNIWDSFMEISMMIFIFMCCMWSLALCDNGFIYYHWLMIILFSFFICCLGLWVYNPCDMGIIELFIS